MNCKEKSLSSCTSIFSWSEYQLIFVQSSARLGWFHLLSLPSRNKQHHAVGSRCITLFIFAFVLAMKRHQPPQMRSLKLDTFFRMTFNTFTSMFIKARTEQCVNVQQTLTSLLIALDYAGSVSDGKTKIRCSVNLVDVGQSPDPNGSCGAELQKL